MKQYNNPEKSTWPSLLQRPVQAMKQLEATVAMVLEEVRSSGDKAVKKYTKHFDRVTVDNLLVTQEELEKAGDQVSNDLKQAIAVAKNNIEKFHAAQQESELRIEISKGVECWRKSVPIEKVGLYIPGGTAPLFSTVLMLGVPAQLAGCDEIVLCTPPGKDGKVNPVILYAAQLVGISKVVKAGGIQAIGAMAYGTASVPQVYKIFGPGNQYVTAAKQLINKEGIAIDMPAGPSEVMVWADATADPEFIAADLLSQAEHGGDSQVILVTTEAQLVTTVNEAVAEQLDALPRKAIAQRALENSKAFVLESNGLVLDMINAYAPEHLIVAVSNAEQYVDAIKNAGSVFLGNYTPESAGDYASGTNHTLPTNGFAKAYSGVSLDSYLKKITFQKISREGLLDLGPVIEQMAEAEQLMAHKNAVSIRLQKLTAL